MEERHSEQIEQLFRLMYEMMFEYAHSTLKDDSQAEAAVQEAFYIACRKPDSLLASPNPSGWLINTLRSVISNMNRRTIHEQRAIERYLSDGEGKTSVDQPPLRLEVLYGDLAEQEDFHLLKEMAVYGSSCSDLARRRGISVQACKKRIQRAKTKLKKYFQK